MNQTLDFIKNFKVIPLNGNFADKELIDYVKKQFYNCYNGQRTKKTNQKTWRNYNVFIK